MGKVIILKIDDPNDFYYNSILSLLSFQDTETEIVTTAGAKDFVAPDLAVHLAERRVYFKDSEITLTRKEYDILLYFLQNRSLVLTFTQIYEHVWKEPDYGNGQEVVSHHIRSLRRKLHLNQSSSCQISSVRGIGYRFEKV